MRDKLRKRCSATIEQHTVESEGDNECINEQPQWQQEPTRPSDGALEFFLVITHAAAIAALFF